MILKKTSNKESSLATGYALKGVPSWVFTIVKEEMGAQKFTQKSRKRVCPIAVLKPDYMKKTSSTNFEKGGQKVIKLPSSYRLKKSHISQKYRNLDETSMKEISERISVKFTKDWGQHPRLIPVMLPNDIVSGRVRDCSEGKKELIIGGYSKSTRGERWDFFDSLDSQVRYSLRCRIPVYESRVLIDGVTSIVYSREKLELNTNYDFIVFRWFKLSETPDKPVRDNPVYFCFEARRVREDFSPVYDIAGKLSDFEQLSPNWAYDRLTNILILFNSVYMMEGEPTINLILFGGPRLGKSKVLEVFSKVFDEQIHSGTQQTIKGLTGSFYADEARSGALAESKFIFLGDEFFRTGLKEAHQQTDASHIMALLHGIMEHLEHSKKTAPSGKYSRPIFFDKSFLATNNIRNFSEFEKAFQDDPAPFNRLTFAVLSKDVEKRMRDMELIPSSFYWNSFLSHINKAGLNSKTYRKLLMLVRLDIKKVKVDVSKMNKYLFKYANRCHDDFERKEKFLAFVRCFTVFNRIFNHKKPLPIKGKIQPTENDYRDAVELMNFVIDNFKLVCQLP